jgi:hypothetical protein
MSSRQTIPWRRQPPVVKLSNRRLQLLITPASSNHGCDESHQKPIRIKRAATKLPVALADLPPRNNLRNTTRPMGSSLTRARNRGPTPAIAQSHPFCQRCPPSIDPRTPRKIWLPIPRQALLAMPRVALLNQFQPGPFFVPSALILLDSGLRRNDTSGMNQRLTRADA